SLGWQERNLIHIGQTASEERMQNRWGSLLTGLFWLTAIGFSALPLCVFLAVVLEVIQSSEISQPVQVIQSNGISNYSSYAGINTGVLLSIIAGPISLFVIVTLILSAVLNRLNELFLTITKAVTFLLIGLIGFGFTLIPLLIWQNEPS